MANVEFVSGQPSRYTNHVLVERSPAATYQFHGASNADVGAPARFRSRHYYDLEEAKAAARQWAEAHGISVVYLPTEGGDE